MKKIENSGMLGPVVQIISPTIKTQEGEAYVQVCKSHTALAQQGGAVFDHIIKTVVKYLVSFTRTGNPNSISNKCFVRLN